MKTIKKIHFRIKDWHFQFYDILKENVTFITYLTEVIKYCSYIQI